MGLSTNDGDANIACLAEGNTFFKMLQKVDFEILGRVVCTNVLFIETDLAVCL